MCLTVVVMFAFFDSSCCLVFPNRTMLAAAVDAPVPPGAARAARPLAAVPRAVAPALPLPVSDRLIVVVGAVARAAPLETGKRGMRCFAPVYRGYHGVYVMAYFVKAVLTDLKFCALSLPMPP